MKDRNLKVFAIALPILLTYVLVQGLITFNGFRPSVASVSDAPQPPQVTLSAPELSATQVETFVNVERQKAGLSVLVHSEQLKNSACAKLQDMMTRLYWDHNDPDGNPPWHFFDAAGYHYTKSGENLAYGFESDSAVVTGWMNSEGHRKNLLNTGYTEQGICTVVGPYQGGRTNVTVQHLGTR